jgi:hypothetical protein
MANRCYRSASRTLALVAGLIAPAALLGACVDSNHRTTIGTSVKPEAFQSNPGTMRENDGPSLVSVGRSEWETVVYEVPSDGVGHPPNYRTHWLTDQSSARKRGEFPTASTAFDLGKTGDTKQTEEVLIAPFNQFFDVLAMPVLLFAEPPTSIHTSPYRWFERTPRGSVMPVASPCCDACKAQACTGTCAECDACQGSAAHEAPESAPASAPENAGEPAAGAAE